MFRQKFFIIAMALALSGCASSSQHNDPFERSNRFMFKVNVQFDNYILKPVAKGYRYVPSPVRQSVRNFLDNLASPVTLAND
ncbi:MAG: MlaA family lipoprotein, partial [Parvibaculales bacterium]